MSLLLAAPVLGVPYNTTPTNVDATGYQFSAVALGDYNNDGFLDVLVSGRSTNNNNVFLRIYTSNGGAGFNATPIQPGGAGNTTGFRDGGVAWGDFDGDGNLDVVANGLATGGATRQLRVYFNNLAAGTWSIVNVPGAANLGMNLGRVAVADFNNDGTPDILACGSTTGANAGGVLRVYQSLGNRTFGPAVTVSAAGYTNCDVAVGDFDNDGLVDILVEGADTTGVRRLRVYRNTTANGVISFAQVADFATGLSQGAVAWGDLNNDGFLDIVAEGSTSGANGGAQLQFYLNNGAGGFGAAISVDTVTANGLGLWGGGIALGDTDNDGDLDILASGRDRVGTRQLRVYRNNGAATPSFTAVAVTNVGGAGAGYRDGGVAWGDVLGNDRKIDVLVSGTDATGTRRLQVFSNTTAQADVVPTAPATLASTFSFTTAGTSVATFKWDPGTDTAPGATPVNMLDYDLQVSTSAAFTGTYTVPGQHGASPLQGNYLRPPKIYDGNTRHGVVLLSTAPWTPQSAAFGLRTDTTYYFRVRTTDNGLTSSANSATQTLWTGVAPSPTADLLAGSGPNPDNITLSWSSAGDDSTKGNLVAGSSYTVQYSTISSTVWSATSTPSGAFTVNIATSGVVPGSPQFVVLSGLQNGATYYFRLWTRDEVGMLSAISNATSAVAKTGGVIPPGTIVNLAAATGASPGGIVLTWTAPGDDGYTPGTWAASYDIRYSTVAAQSPAANNANFTAAPSVSAFGTIPTPAVEGSTETMTLAGLIQGGTYYFAIKARDPELNVSALSNGATTWAQIDTTPPGRVTDLAGVPGSGAGEIDLTWTAPGDDGYTPGTTAKTYDIRYATTAAQSPALSLANFNAAPSINVFISTPAPSVEGTAEALTVPGLLEGVTYYFALRTADETPNSSALSTGATAYATVSFRSITVDVPAYIFGPVQVGLSTQTTVQFNVTYNGNTDATFSLSAATATAGSPWTLGTTTATDRARLYANFNSVMPLSGNFAATDVVLTAPQTCDSLGTFFEGDEACFSLSDGASVDLWFRLDMPGVSTALQPDQLIQVTLTAGP